MAKTKKQKLLELKIAFNDVALREFGLDVDEDTGYVYDAETEEMWAIKGKCIKYSEDEYPVIRHNEVELNLLENPSLMEMLYGKWIQLYAAQHDITIQSYGQVLVRDSKLGYFNTTYFVKGQDQMKEYLSDVFTNESVRIFNLVCKLNHRTRLYDLKEFDIEMPRRDGK